VVVFKTPTDKPAYAVNYIKRLTGLPGEWIMILDGDVYVCDDPQYADVPRSQALREIPASAWKIQNKPAYAQEALWRVIYDHDYRPLDKERTDGWKLPWQQTVGNGWRTGAEADATPAQRLSRVFSFNNPDGRGELKFRWSSLPGMNSQHTRAGYFTDWLAYDVTMINPAAYPVYTITDLRLAFTYDRKSGDGPLFATLNKYDHEFVLRLDVDKVTLTHKPPGSARNDGTALAPLRRFNPSKEKGPIRVEFENADYQVRVRLNGELVFETTREEFAPDVAKLLTQYNAHTNVPVPEVSIDAEKQEAALSHVSLWRDVYYTPENSQDRREITHGRPSNPMKLGPDEYFVMGDNSAGSFDARYWMDAVDLPEEHLHAESGRVPGRFMLGRAFFVYWPAGYRPLNTAPALVPNFGDMRLIH
jgi:signal peptidase I